MSIKTRLLLLLIPAIFVTLAVLTLSGYVNANRQGSLLAHTEAQNIALEQSALTFNKLRQAEAAASALAASLVEMRGADNVDRQAMSLAVKGVAASSKDYFGVWALFEPNAYDGKDADYVDNEALGNGQGRANAYWLMDAGGELSYDLSDNYDHEPYYTLPMQNGRLTIIPPYRDMDTKEKTLMSTITMPIRAGGKVLGVVGIDLEMDFIQGLIKAVTPYGSGYAMLISDTGAIIAEPGEPRAEADLPQVPQDTLRKMREGKPFSVSAKSVLDKTTVQCFYTPVKLESFAAPWYFMVALPMDKVMADTNHNLLLQLGIGILALLVLVALVFYTANGVSAPLRRIVAHAQAVAAGNYASKLGGGVLMKELQELRVALRSMIDSLLETMQTVEKTSQETALEAERARKATAEAEKAREKSEENRKAMLDIAGRVDAVSQKLRSTSQELTDKIAMAGNETLQQNALMEETVTAIAAMSGSIVRVSENAGDAAEFTERTRARAGEGAEIVNKTLRAFDEIRRETETLGGQIVELGKSTEAIGGILGLINDIADQTNLLALNAAIEAARAGDAGRGFAVVADEVRKLAEKTVEATRQVHESVNSIRSSMSVSADGVSRTVETVHATVALGHEAQSSLKDIVELVQAMNEQIHDIARLCHDQAATSEQVTAIVERLRGLSLTVGKAMDEGAAISRDLAPEARELGLLVEQLTAK